MDQRKLDLAQAYDAGAANAYYGRRPSGGLQRFGKDLELCQEYLRGYDEKPFGEKVYE